MPTSDIYEISFPGLVNQHRAQEIEACGTWSILTQIVVLQWNKASVRLSFEARLWNECKVRLETLDQLIPQWSIRNSNQPVFLSRNGGHFSPKKLNTASRWNDFCRVVSKQVRRTTKVWCSVENCSLSTFKNYQHHNYLTLLPYLQFSQKSLYIKLKFMKCKAEFVRVSVLVDFESL